MTIIANCNYLPDVTIFLFFSFSQNDTIGFFMNTEDNSDIESSSDEDEFDLAMLRLRWAVMHQMI